MPVVYSVHVDAISLFKLLSSMSLSIANTTALPVRGLYAGALYGTVTVAINSTSMGLPGVSGSQEEWPPLPLTAVDNHNVYCWLHTMLQQQPPNQVAQDHLLPLRLVSCILHR